jgi:hypothetical protein
LGLAPTAPTGRLFASCLDVREAQAALLWAVPHHRRHQRCCLLVGAASTSPPPRRVPCGPLEEVRGHASVRTASSSTDPQWRCHAGTRTRPPFSLSQGGSPATDTLEGRDGSVGHVGRRRQLHRPLPWFPARGRAARRGGGGEMSCGAGTTSANHAFRCNNHEHRVARRELGKQTCRSACKAS